MQSNRSPKLNFLDKGGEDDSDLFDNLVHVQPNEYRPNKTGTRMHLSLARTRIVRGGLGSGKTRSACEHINNLALQYPGSLHFVGRKDITTLKDTTQREFLEFVVRPETIQAFNVNENKLYYKNGSIVLFKETKDRNKVKSLQLTSYMLDEADENEDESIWSFLDDRLRQKVNVGGVLIEPPYAGLLVFNPTHDEHWLCELSQRKDISLEDFKFDTYENQENLPSDYIPNLLAKLPPWDVDRLVHGNWGRQTKGKPVIHGFGAANIMPLKFRDDLPLVRGWDFGFNHPAVRFAQIDPVYERFYAHREFFARDTKLPDVAQRVKEITASICGPCYPVMDWGDPHGKDQKDLGESSIEYLRIHHGIFVMSKRQRIKTGIDEIQHKVLTRAAHDPNKPDEEIPLFVVDPSCRVTIGAYSGGYHRDETGEPSKDGYWDHLPDADRYIIANTMGAGLRQRFKNRPKYQPRNMITGY